MAEIKAFVQGLPFNTDDNALYEAFKGFGNCTEAKVCYDRDTGNSRGFGFVSYDNDEALEKAIKEMDGKDFGGRYLAVKKAMPKAPREEGAAASGGDRACYGCGQTGHMSRDCPSKVAGGDRDCFDFKKGNCARGDSCKFNHGATGAGNAKPRAGPGACFAFQKGNCSKGASCRFAHEGAAAPGATPNKKKKTFDDDDEVAETETAPAVEEEKMVEDVKDESKTLGKRSREETEANDEEGVEGGSPAKKAKSDKFNWKKTLVKLVEAASGEVALKDLRKEAMEAYKNAGNDVSNKDEFKSLFEEKLAKVKKVVVDGKKVKLAAN